MLVISRKKGQRIFINGKEMIITVLHADKGWAELGFDAPENIKIDREERLHQQHIEKTFTQPEREK